MPGSPASDIVVRCCGLLATRARTVLKTYDHPVRGRCPLPLATPSSVTCLPTQLVHLRDDTDDAKMAATQAVIVAVALRVPGIVVFLCLNGDAVEADVAPLPDAGGNVRTVHLLGGSLIDGDGTDNLPEVRAVASCPADSLLLAACQDGIVAFSVPHVELDLSAAGRPQARLRFARAPTPLFRLHEHNGVSSGLALLPLSAAGAGDDAANGGTQTLLFLACDAGDNTIAVVSRVRGCIGHIGERRRGTGAAEFKQPRGMAMLRWRGDVAARTCGCTPDAAATAPNAASPADTDAEQQRLVVCDSFNGRLKIVPVLEDASDAGRRSAAAVAAAVPVIDVASSMHVGGFGCPTDVAAIDAAGRAMLVTDRTLGLRLLRMRPGDAGSARCFSVLRAGADLESAEAVAVVPALRAAVVCDGARHCVVVQELSPVLFDT